MPVKLIFYAPVATDSIRTHFYITQACDVISYFGSSFLGYYIVYFLFVAYKISKILPFDSTAKGMVSFYKIKSPCFHLIMCLFTGSIIVFTIGDDLFLYLFLSLIHIS